MKNLQTLTTKSTREEVTSVLDSDGAVMISGLVDPSTLLEELSPYFDSSQPSQGPFYGYNTHRIGGLVRKSKTCRDIAINDFILSAIEHTLSPNCDNYQLNLTQGIEIKPGERAQFLHRDDAMFPTAGHMESMINVIVAVTDFTKENGATRLIPGSHKWAADRMPEDGETIYAEMPAGSCLIYVGGILHAGSANTSTESRIGAVISYSLGWLKQAENFFLSVPWDDVAVYPTQLQKLLGYQIHRPNLGWVEGIEPLKWIESGRPQVIAAEDALPEQFLELAKLTINAPEKFSAYLS